MLTAKKIAFVEYYKIHRNASEAAKLAGYSAKTAARQTTRLLKDAEISSAIAKWEAEEREKVANLVPSKQSYLVQTFVSAQKENHSPTRAKYWELGGKVLGYLSDEEKEKQGNVINILCNDLHLSITRPVDANAEAIDITPKDISPVADDDASQKKESA